jgi:peptidoglycan/LPS O-acetylase OafA/YrhL
MKLNYIDALRGLAVLSVIWFHCHLHHYSNPAYYSIMDVLGSPAALGVQLFYVLSAFTLFMSMNKQGVSPGTNRRFALRRFFRIAPLYYLAMLYYVWQKTDTSGLNFASELALNASGLMTNALFLHGLSPEWINAIVPGGWSVGIEVLFYALVPFLFVRIRSLNSAVIFMATTMIAGFLLTTLLTDLPQFQSNPLLQDYLYYYIPYQLPVFGCGIVAYFVVIRHNRRLNPLALCSLVAALLLLVLSKTLGRSAFPNLPHTIHLLASIGFTLLIILLSRGNKSGLLVNRFTRYMGTISYSAYLTHFGVLYWMDRVMPRQLVSVHNVTSNILNFQLKFLLVVVVTVLVSTLTYRFIEVPTQQVGRWILRKPAPAPTPVPQAVDRAVIA